MQGGLIFHSFQGAWTPPEKQRLYLFRGNESRYPPFMSTPLEARKRGSGLYFVCILRSVSLCYPWIPSKKFSPFGSAVCPAIRNIHSNVLEDMKSSNTHLIVSRSNKRTSKMSCFTIEKDNKVLNQGSTRFLIQIRRWRLFLRSTTKVDLFIWIYNLFFQN